jgi:hypothetical protein
MPVLDITADFTNHDLKTQNLLLLQPGGYQAGTFKDLTIDSDSEDYEGMNIFKIEMTGDNTKAIFIKTRNKVVIYDMKNLEILDELTLPSGDITDFSYNKFMKKLFILGNDKRLHIVKMVKKESMFKKSEFYSYNLIKFDELHKLCSLAVEECGDNVVVSGYYEDGDYPVNLLCVLKLEGGQIVGEFMKVIEYKFQGEYCKGIFVDFFR